MQVVPTLFLYTKGLVFVWAGDESIWSVAKGNPCSFYFFFFCGARGWVKNIQTYLFKCGRGFTCLASASGEPLLKLFKGRGMSRNFSGMGEWKNMQTFFCLYMGRG